MRRLLLMFVCVTIVCFVSGSAFAQDTDGDGIPDSLDNCPIDYNPNQEDSYPPGGNDCGDACECEGNFDGDQDVDGTDAAVFKTDFGRSSFSNPCDTCNDSPCPYGMVDCGNKCVDPLTDEDFCGVDLDCLGGTVCGTGEICDGGVCTLSCQTGLINCNGICVNTEIDERYCGSCTNDCASGEMCIMGSCDIPSPTCAGTLSPLGRWCDQEDGTVKDMYSGLVWLKKADWGGRKPWEDCTTHDDAHTRVGILYAGMSGADLTDGSVEGDWRLPTKAELVGITEGDEYIRSSQMYFFTGVQSDFYWSSTTYAIHTPNAFRVDMFDGLVRSDPKTYTDYVWPVRLGRSKTTTTTTIANYCDGELCDTNECCCENIMGGDPFCLDDYTCGFVGSHCGSFDP